VTAGGGFTLERLASFRAKIEREREKAPDRPLIAQLEGEYARRRAELAAELGLAESEIDARVEAILYGPPPDPDELVPEDDAVIGRALRRSLAVAAAVVLLVALGIWLARRPEPAAPEHALAAAAPHAVEAAATEAAPPALPFTDVAAAAGVAFVHSTGAYGDKLLPETMGGGVAFLDYDGDGDQDLLFVNSDHWRHRPLAGARPRHALYENDGAGRFTDATARAGLTDSFYGQGVAVGDYDNDGDPDLFFTAVGLNRLYENRDGRFADVTARAGVAGDAGEWSTAAAFADYDNDGDLDLFVANYVRWSKEIDFQVDYRLVGVGRAYGPPNNYEGTYPYLYRNEGDGTFSDVSAAAGVQVDNPATLRPASKGLGVAPRDADGDGWLDFLLANDTVGKFLFHNRGDGTFEEVGAAWGLAYDRVGSATGSMGIDSGTLRNDGDLAFLVGNFANEMTSVFVSQGDRRLYADEAIPEGIGAPSRTALTFGLFLFDADLDGRLDLLQVNGHLEEEIAKVDPSQSYRQAAQLFWNAGGEARQPFVLVPAETTGDLARPIVGRGSAYADIDGDGDLDAVLTQAGGPPLVLRNDQALGRHWLRVKLVGDPAAGVNRDAIGAEVALTAGGVTQSRQVMPTKSYLSQSELPLTFGLGAAVAVDRLTVTWPGGAVQEVAVEGLDREITVAYDPAAATAP